MNKKISIGLAIALIFLSITATFAITMTVSQNIYNGLVSRLSNRSELYDGYSAIDGYVRTNFYGDFDDDALFAYTAQGYMKGLNDPGSFYMTAKEYIEYTRRMAGEGGIGVDVSYDSAADKMVITQVYADSSAESAELKQGDVIVAIDDKTVNASNAYEIMDSLRVGRRFNTVSVTYERGGSRKTVSVVRGFARTVTSSVLGKTGYVRITGFYANTAEQLSQEIAKLTDQGVTALIIDVRGCDEGLIENASAAVDLLLPSGAETTGAIASAIGKNGKVLMNFTSDTQCVTFPKGIVVLIDGSTSGAAELLAAQLHDFSKCTLLGVKTAGEMTLQKIFEMENGSAISLTVAKVKTYNGDFYCDGAGLEPDETVELASRVEQSHDLEDVGADNQLAAALTKLSND